jgi:predicted nucleic acid-binding Zn ribbon protein
MSRTGNFNRWRASLPWKEVECVRCGAAFVTQRAAYCSQTCRAYTHKERKTGKKVGAEKHCWWCCDSIPDGRHKFCSQSHLDLFKSARRAGRPIVLDIKGYRVETRQWDRVGEVIRGWLDRIERDCLV